MGPGVGYALVNKLRASGNSRVALGPLGDRSRRWVGVGRSRRVSVEFPGSVRASVRVKFFSNSQSTARQPQRQGV